MFLSLYHECCQRQCLRFLVIRRRPTSVSQRCFCWMPVYLLTRSYRSCQQQGFWYSASYVRLRGNLVSLGSSVRGRRSIQLGWWKISFGDFSGTTIGLSSMMSFVHRYGTNARTFEYTLLNVRCARLTRRMLQYHTSWKHCAGMVTIAISLQETYG